MARAVVSKKAPFLAKHVPNWRSEDSVVVLASYLGRPAGWRRPPEDEMQRVANLVRQDIEVVRRRIDGFRFLDTGRPDDVRPSHRDKQIWERYRDDPMQCAMDADWIIEGRKWRPAWLYK